MIYRAPVANTGLNPRYFFHVRDEKTANTASGASNAGSNIRVLNTIKTNSIPGATLVANQISLPAGTYLMRFSCGAFYSGAHRAGMYVPANSTYAILGRCESNNFTTPTAPASTASSGEGIVVFAATTVLELRQKITAAYPGAGLGIAVNDAYPEVYADVFIEKLL